MNDSWSCANGFKFYEQLRVVDDMNDYKSHEFGHLDAMKSLGVWMI